MEAGLDGDNPLTVAQDAAARTSKDKAELEGGLSEFVLNCTACGIELHWFGAPAWPTLGTGGIASRAPHDEPSI